MMNDILQADQRDEQDGKGGTPTEEIAKEVRKEEADKSDIPSENANSRKKCKGKKEKTDEFILPS